MTERKSLPPRSTRGVRPQTTPEQDEADNQLYQRFFERANENVTHQSTINNGNHEDHKPTIDYRANLGINRPKYPFSRGYHYFFNLEGFPRAEGSQSYAIDQDNIFNYTYPQQDKQIGELTVGQLINRKLVGLPMVGQNQRRAHQRDKNVCHGDLFQNEDKKYYLDRALSQLRYIQKNIEQLVENRKIQQHGCLRKDIDLINLLEDEIDLEEKKKILEKKIKILKERKDNMKNFFVNKDKLYFRHSLNQKMHNLIDKLESSLAFECIIVDLFGSDHVRTDLSYYDQFTPQQVQPLFTYFNAQNACLSNQKLSSIAEKINKQFFHKDESNFWSLIVPNKIFSFANEKLFKLVEDFVGLRMQNVGESSLFMGKTVWKKLFKRELIVSKEKRNLIEQELEQKLYSCLHELGEWVGRRNEDPEIYPILDEMVDDQAFNEDNAMKKHLFKHTGDINLNPREYACLAFAYQIYSCLGQIYGFIEENQEIIQILASESYHKVSHALVETMNSPIFALLDPAINKFMKFSSGVDIDVECQIKWQYEKDKGVGFVWKESIPEWETEKEEEDELEDTPCKK